MLSHVTLSIFRLIHQFFIYQSTQKYWPSGMNMVVFMKFRKHLLQKILTLQNFIKRFLFRIILMCLRIILAVWCVGNLKYSRIMQFKLSVDKKSIQIKLVLNYRMFPSHYMLKVNNRNTRTRCEVNNKDTRTTPMASFSYYFY